MYPIGFGLSYVTTECPVKNCPVYFEFTEDGFVMLAIHLGEWHLHSKDDVEKNGGVNREAVDRIIYKSNN